jgi:hypothetical protein
VYILPKELVAPVALPEPADPTTPAPITPMPVPLPVTFEPVLDYTDADDENREDPPVTTAPDTPRPTTQFLPLKETEDPPSLGDSSASMLTWCLTPTVCTVVAALLVALFL